MAPANPEVVQLAERVRALLAREPAVAERRMFGGIAFLINGNLAVSASRNGGLMLRCEPAETERLVEGRGVSRVVMRGREMDGWIRVSAATVAADEALDRWVRSGVAYARRLPPKEAGRTSTR